MREESIILERDRHSLENREVFGGEYRGMRKG
jgi:hypothetical protein